MKTGLIAFLFVAFASTAFADTVLSTSTVQLPVDISSAKVVKTNKGYGTTYLVKVLIPALAGPTLMNHRNDGEPAPCMATYETNQISDIVQNNPETLSVPVSIQLVKSVAPSADGKTCQVLLTENVSTIIRGFHFVHSRSQQMPDRDIADCN